MVRKGSGVRLMLRGIFCLLIVTSQWLFLLVGVSHGSETACARIVSVVETGKPSAPAVLPRELLVLLLISVGAAAFNGILYLWNRKSEEMSKSKGRYEDSLSRMPSRSNPRDSSSSRRLKKSASLRPIEDGPYSFGCRERDSHLKLREVSSLLQPRGSVSSGGRSRDVSPAEFREAISSLRLRNRLSGSSVFAVIRLPFVEEE